MEQPSAEHQTRRVRKIGLRQLYPSVMQYRIDRIDWKNCYREYVLVNQNASVFSQHLLTRLPGLVKIRIRRIPCCLGRNSHDDTIGHLHIGTTLTHNGVAPLSSYRVNSPTYSGSAVSDAPTTPLTTPPMSDHGCEGNQSSKHPSHV